MNWQDDFINKIICGDCLEVMKEIPDKCVDLILTDPPYGIKEDGGKCRANKNRPSYEIKKKTPKYKKANWDKKRMGLIYFSEMFRVSKNQIIFGANYYCDYLKPSMGWIFWDKMFENQDFSDGELIFTSFKRALKKIRISSKDGTRGGKDRVHPTQKPLRLITWILENYSTKGDLIFDPFLGSGTTALVCKNLKHNFIGIEISPDYCKIAEERLAQGIL